MKLREPFTFVTDRCLGKHAAPDAVRSSLLAGEHIVRLDEHYPPDAQDADWLPEVGAKGWVVLTKDSEMRRRPHEVQALLAARTAVFIFANGNANTVQIALAFKVAMPRIRKAVRRFAVPVLGRITTAVRSR